MDTEITRENRFRTIFDNSYQFMSLLKPDGTVIDINRTAETFIGEPRDRLIGRKYWESSWWHGPAAQEGFIRARVERAAAGENVRFEAEVRGQDDLVFIVDFSIKPIRDTKGRIVELITEGHDINVMARANTRQRRALERRLQESETMAGVSRALGGTLEPQAVLELLARTANDIVPRSDWAIIHLLQGRPELLVPVATAGEKVEHQEYIIAPTEGAAGLALLSGGVINVGDTQSDPRPSAFAHIVGLRSLLVAPVQTSNRQLGVITLHCSRPFAFTEGDERLLTILATQAGLVIENAQLFDSQRRARLVAELQRKKLRKLTERLVSAQEEERLRISRELHDGAGQALTSLKISLDLLQRQLPPGQQATRERLADLSKLTGETMDSLRTLAHDLRPPGLDSFGLDVALAGLCHDFGNRTGLQIDYKGVDVPDLPLSLSLSMYRFAQEALTNVAKHAGAQRVTIELQCEDNVLSLLIADDGRGFTYEPEASGSGVGLVSMQERTDLLGGVLDIDSAPGRGTRLIARVPIDIPVEP